MPSSFSYFRIVEPPVQAELPAYTPDSRLRRTLSDYIKRFDRNSDVGVEATSVEAVEKYGGTVKLCLSVDAKTALSPLARLTDEELREQTMDYFNSGKPPRCLKKSVRALPAAQFEQPVVATCRQHEAHAALIAALHFWRAVQAIKVLKAIGKAAWSADRKATELEENMQSQIVLRLLTDIQLAKRRQSEAEGMLAWPLTVVPRVVRKWTYHAAMQGECAGAHSTPT